MSLREASQPLYHVVSRRLADEIAAGALLAGDRLPSERWLCDELGVSRATVRRAIEELVAGGLLEARGRGAYVRGRRLGEPRNSLMSLSELGRSRGLEASSRVLGAEVRPASLDEADLFAIGPGAELFELRRLRMLDGLPMSLDVNRVPLRLAPELTAADFTGASLYALLDAAGHAPVRADYDVEARAADADVAELLGVAAGAPVLATLTLAFAASGRVVDAARTTYRGDRYRFQATLLRRTHGEGGER